MAAKNGKKLILLADGIAIAAAKTDDIQSSVETLEVSSPYIGGWKTSVAKRKEWKFSTSYLVMSESALNVIGYSGIQDLLNVGRSFTIIFHDADGTDLGVTGTAILTSVRITAHISKLVQGYFEFKGNGPLTAVENDNNGGLE